VRQTFSEVKKMTRFDYEYIRNHDVPGWLEQWTALLNRFAVQGGELIEDKNAEIFRLGFTVDDVEASVNHTGYTERELQWYQGQPDRYSLIDGRYVEVSDWQAKKLIEAKNKKHSDLQVEKVRRRDAGITIEGVLWDTDSNAQVMYTQVAFELASNPAMVVDDWKASNGIYTKMDAATFAKIRTAWAAHCTSITSTQRRKSGEIDTLSTIAAVDEYDVSAGW
jgi:hypothetical protein